MTDTPTAPGEGLAPTGAAGVVEGGGLVVNGTEIAGGLVAVVGGVGEVVVGGAVVVVVGFVVELVVVGALVVGGFDVVPVAVVGGTVVAAGIVVWASRLPLLSNLATKAP